MLQTLLPSSILFLCCVSFFPLSIVPLCVMNSVFISLPRTYPSASIWSVPCHHQDCYELYPFSFTLLFLSFPITSVTNSTSFPCSMESPCTLLSFLTRFPLLPWVLCSCFLDLINLHLFLLPFVSLVAWGLCMVPIKGPAVPVPDDAIMASMHRHCILRCLAVHLFGIVWAPGSIYKGHHVS